MPSIYDIIISGFALYVLFVYKSVKLQLDVLERDIDRIDDDARYIARLIINHLIDHEDDEAECDDEDYDGDESVTMRRNGPCRTFRILPELPESYGD